MCLVRTCWTCRHPLRVELRRMCIKYFICPFVCTNFQAFPATPNQLATNTSHSIFIFVSHSHASSWLKNAYAVSRNPHPVMKTLWYGCAFCVVVHIGRCVLCVQSFMYICSLLSTARAKSLWNRDQILYFNGYWTKTNRKMKHLYMSSISSAPSWTANLTSLSSLVTKSPFLSTFRIGGAFSGASVSARVAAQLLAAPDHAHRERRRLGRHCEEVPFPLRRRTGRDWVDAHGGRQQVERFGHRGSNGRCRRTRPNLDATSNGK